MLKITSKQADKVHRLVKEQCANCDENGNCILLDDGEAHRCVQLISIQENINSTTGEGMEMLPFYNIFNEWYAAQTSKKIRAVQQSKAEHGERVASAVPFGYMKYPENSKQWIIDEPAAEIVKKIYSLCLAGRGLLQIAKQLEREKVLVPTAYFESVGRKIRNASSLDPYAWNSSVVVGILENRQYTGCAVNFKTTTVVLNYTLPPLRVLHETKSIFVVRITN